MTHAAARSQQGTSNIVGAEMPVVSGVSARSHKSSSWRRTALLITILVLAPLAVFFQVGDHDFIYYDDQQYVTDNNDIQRGLSLTSVAWAFTTTRGSNWHPLTWISHMLDFRLFGMNPRGHHIVNLIFHLLNTVLIFLVFKKLAGEIWKPFVIAALFAVHPLHVESVAWVSERKDVLSTFFWFLTIWGYLRYVDRRSKGRYLALLLFFTLGLLSKPMLVTLPFVLLLLDYWPLDRLATRGTAAGPAARARLRARFLVLEKAPLFVLAAVAAGLTYWASLHQGDLVSYTAITLKVRIANAIVSYVKYIAMMIWPAGLTYLYPYPKVFLLSDIFGAALLLALLSLLAFATLRRHPFLAVGWLWYLGTLVPVLGLIQIGAQSMSDRYTYIPLTGLFVIVAWGAPLTVSTWRQGKNLLAPIAMIILLLYGLLARRQVGYWKDSIILNEHALEVTTHTKRLLRNNLGIAFYRQGRTMEAINQYRQALAEGSRNPLVYMNLGLALMKEDLTEEAIEKYEKALQIEPDYAQAHNNLGFALEKQGRTSEAVEHYLETLRIAPDHVEANNNLGAVLYREGKTAEAVAHYRRALRTNPDFGKAHFNLGLALVSELRLDEAIEHYRESLRLNPDSAETLNSLGAALYRRRELEAAVTHFRESLRVNPDYGPAQRNLEMALPQIQGPR